MQRRTIMAGLVPIALAACGQPGADPINNPIHVELASAQTWAADVTAAVSGFADQALAMPSLKLPAQTVALVRQALALLKASNDDFQSLQSGSTAIRSLATAIITAASQLVGMLGPLVPALAATTPVGMGIQMGLAVLTALVNSIAMASPPVPAALHRAAVTRGRAY